jgi:drug/metabolite transporter (DMT)-like permease
MTLLVTAFLWSTGGLLIKYIPWSGFSIASIRGLISTLALLGLRRLGQPAGARIPLCFSKHNVAAGVAMFLTSTLFLAANKLTTAANAIVLQYIAPILILLYTAIVEKRKPSKVEILLTAMVFLGCVLAFSDQLGGSGTLGDILAILSGVAFTALLLISGKEKTQVQDGQVIGSFLSFLCCLPFLFFDEKLALAPESVGAMLFLGLFQYSLAYFLFAKGVKMTGPVAASIILMVEPIMNPVWVFLALGEAPGPMAMAGFVLVVVAVTLLSLLPFWGKKRKG